MRKEYGKALRTAFAAEMKQAASHFQEVKVQSLYFWPGDRAFCWQATDQLYCWIVLSPSNKDYNEFTVLIGWSKLARYPELSMVPCAEHPSLHHDEFANREYLTRLPYLWGKEDNWWVIEAFSVPQILAELEASQTPIPTEEARAVVAPLVKDAINKIKTQGLPYLESLVRSEGNRSG